MRWPGRSPEGSPVRGSHGGSRAGGSSEPVARVNGNPGRSVFRPAPRSAGGSIGSRAPRPASPGHSPAPRPGSPVTAPLHPGVYERLLHRGARGGDRRPEGRGVVDGRRRGRRHSPHLVRGPGVAGRVAAGGLVGPPSRRPLDRAFLPGPDGPAQGPRQSRHPPRAKGPLPGARILDRQGTSQE